MPTTTLDPLAAVERLDPLPTTLQRLIALLGDENAPLKAVVEIIELDPAVTANVLRLANSSLFPGRRVDTVRDAVSRLGTVELLNITLSDVVKGMVQPAPVYGLSASDLWLHAVAAQAAAADLTRRCRSAAIPGVASTAALLHDIGKLVMAREFGTDSAALAYHVEEHGVSWIEAERELTGTDHAAVGLAIARHWNFPDTLAQAIGLHHQVELENPSPLLDAVIASDLVARTAGHGIGHASLIQPFDHAAFARLGIDVPTFAACCGETARRVADVRRLFHL